MITPDKMVEKMMTGQGYGWVLVGVKGYVVRPTGHSSVTLFPCLCQLRIGRCISLVALIHESSGDPVRLIFGSSTVVSTERWK